MTRWRASAAVAVAVSLVWSGAAAGQPTGPVGPAVTDPVGAGSDPASSVDGVGVEGRVVVRWHEGVGDAERGAVVAGVPAAGPVTRTSIGDRVELLDLTSGATAAAVSWLRGQPAVAQAEADHRIVAPAFAAAGEPAVATAGGPLASPDDPYFGQQWGLGNTGQVLDGGLPEPWAASAGVDVRALEAWSVTRGTPEVVVAVIDTGVDAGHPDLADAVVGRFETIPSPGPSLLHGTSVASVIAARADDGFGVAGVAPEVGVLSIAAFSSQGDEPGFSTLSSVVAAFEIAASEGADVINASWVTTQDSPLLRAVVADAGVPVIAASGNDEPGRLLTGADSIFPAGYELPNVVAVTAVGPDGGVPLFANVGREVVDLGAPGELVLAAVPDGGHGWVAGTSFAAPFVSGAVALALSAAPYATSGDLVDAVTWTSRPLPALDGVTRTGGLLDAAALVRGVQRPVCRPDLLAPAGFVDVAPGNVHGSGIDCLAALAITTGRTADRFDPAGTVTRAQLAGFVDRIVTGALGAWEVGPPPFDDVTGDATHAVAIARLAELGILSGTDGRFAPHAPVTRGQLAAILVRTHDLLTGTAAPPSRGWFDDTTGTTHGGAIDRARDLGLVRGVTRVAFEPGAVTRRDQMASLLARTVDALARGEVEVG